MTGDEKIIIDYLKDSIDNLASKFETFLNKQENMNEKVRENSKDLSDIKEAKLITTVAQHDADLKILKESKEAKWAQRHPVVAGGLNYIILIVIFVVIAHFAPGVAHLIGSV